MADRIKIGRMETPPVAAHVLGIFRDLDDPDRFVWMRGFQNMAARHAALLAFYTGPVWRANSHAANATMLDSSNVLLLRPLPKSDGLVAPQRPSPTGIVRVSISDVGAESKFTQALAQRSGWRDRVSEPLWPALMRRPEVLRLAPASRSRLG